MSLHRFSVVLLIAAALTFVGWGGVGAQKSEQYRDTKGVDVLLSLGPLSFADQVVSFEVGAPPAQRLEFRDPSLSLGPPNYISTDSADFTTLGCGGVLVLEFKDNALVDGPGADLHVFEVGPDVEAMELAISADGKTWTEVGSISGGNASVDIGELAAPQETYRFVRLTDLKASCRSRWPGADIDAVAAVGGAVRLSLSSVVLFEFDKHELKPDAASELEKVVERAADFRGARMIIEGHTDSIGTPTYNRDLSERRASAVVDFLQGRLPGHTLEVRGFGETRPVATNATDEGRQENRRVEILIIPAVN